MSEHLRWFVGNRLPSITENIVYADGTPVDLTGATVKFQMRKFGTSTLKVDALAQVVTPAQGIVRYDWAAVDVDTAGDYLVWWQVTAGGKTQDMGEAFIEIMGHTPLSGYVELEGLKSTVEIASAFADQDIQLSIMAASNAVDAICGRTFNLAASATRKFTAISEDYLMIDDVLSITSVDNHGTALVQNTDYYLDGTNVLRMLNGGRFNRGVQAVTVVANFGFAEVPAEINRATTLIAEQILKRTREAPFGVLALTLDGSAIRIGRTDPHLDMMLAKWKIPMMVE